MSQETVEPGSSQRIPVRIRHISGAEGHASAEHIVYCPSRQCTIPLEECSRCEHCTAVFTDNGLEAEVLCSHGSGVTPPGGGEEAAKVANGIAPIARGERTPLCAIMTGDVYCVTEELVASDLATVLVDRHIGGAPVVDKAGHLIGIVSKTDLVREEVPPETRVSELMSSVSFSLNEGATVTRAAALMAYESVHRIPVVDGDNKVVGIVSAIDVLRWLAQEAGYVIPRGPRAPVQGKPIS